jgi:hypothetical protein
MPRIPPPRCVLLPFGLIIACLIVTVMPAWPSYLAVSLGRMEDAARAGRSDREATDLAGINRVLGMIVDPAGDVIVIGQHDPDLPPLLRDHLATALRALAVADKFPLVSLDATNDTRRDGLLHVRFEGGIAQTRLGHDLLDSDVSLKRLALGLSQANGVKSYLDLSVTEPDAGQTVHARFWFVPADRTRLFTRDGVFVIRQLDVVVRAEIVGAGASDPVANRFADAVTSALGRIAATSPEIAQVKPLFDVASLAAAIKAAAPPNMLSYWAHEYPLPAMQTPETFAVLRNRQSTASGVVIEAQGGVDLEVLTAELAEGDTDALRQAVLLARPDRSSLSWVVPLANWPSEWKPLKSDQAGEQAAQSMLLRHAGGSVFRFQVNDSATNIVGNNAVTPLRGALVSGPPLERQGSAGEGIVGGVLGARPSDRDAVTWRPN